MAKGRPEILVTQSLLDRLTSHEQWPETRNASITMFRESLKRDLEWLLNTRQPITPELEDFPLAKNSMLRFGFPDIHSFSTTRGKDPAALARAMEECIKLYEPRISEPRVELARSDMLSRSMKFHVGGKISYENMEEEIKFDTVLELIRGEYEVS